MASPAVLRAVFNHLVLPPRLPGKHDGDAMIEDVEKNLFDRFSKAVRTIQHLTHHDLAEEQPGWDKIRVAILSAKALNAGTKVNKVELLKSLSALQNDHILILRITEQNAGLVLYRNVHNIHGDGVTFEAFEASAASENVLAAKSALKWTFPGMAVHLPYATFAEFSFQHSLATFLEKASLESISQFGAHTLRAGAWIPEFRDTAHPAIISQMLMALLEVNGHRVHSVLLGKRVRDDVCWFDGATKPWRRSPMYLVLRVALQRHLCSLYGDEKGTMHFKFLIALLLAQFLDDIRGMSSPQFTNLLKTKIARRLAKLAMNREHIALSSHYGLMISILRPTFENSLRSASAAIDTAWSHFKRVNCTRSIKSLPQHADAQSLQLTLLHSGTYLREALANASGYGLHQVHVVKNFDHSVATTKQYNNFFERYSKLSKIEIEFEEAGKAALGTVIDPEEQCVGLAKSISAYMTTVGSAYDSDPQQKSTMLLTLMQLWVAMDKIATELYPVLLHFDPAFPPEILDVLQLSSLADMNRLRVVETHIRNRHVLCGPRQKTIFDDPSVGSFADQYFQSADGAPMQDLLIAIQASEQQSRVQKEAEWATLTAQHTALLTQISVSSCLFMTEDHIWYEERVHDDQHCTKCDQERKAHRMTIEIHEDYLPARAEIARAVVFELLCPQAFASYRQATWQIIGKLGLAQQTQGTEPRIVVSEYKNLRQFSIRPQSLTLGSTTKSFLNSHHAFVRLPTPKEDVLLPNALKFGYFDRGTQLWPGRVAFKPNFAHHISALRIEPSSPWSPLLNNALFVAGAGGPSSNAVVASQTKCPNALNVHEFMAFQYLFSGFTRRWPMILVELGSSQMSFSTEATMLLMSRLTLEAGPSDLKDPENPLRIVHVYLRDNAFCTQLLNQLSRRLATLASNWRETHSMELIINLVLRLCFFSTGFAAQEANRLLLQTRETIAHWLTLLRIEMHTSTNASSPLTCSKYAVRAALLLKRTFLVYTDTTAGVWREQGPDATLIPGSQLQLFLEAAIVIQDNLNIDPQKLPYALRIAIAADIKLTHRLRILLRASLDSSPDSLEHSIRRGWPEPEGSSRNFSELQYLSDHEYWVQTTVTAANLRPQTLHFHILNGALLIDGQLLGKMPAEHRESVVLCELFGEQQLFTYPSSLPGMRYALTLSHGLNGHQIHVGFHHGRMRIRARFANRILELVHRNEFRDPHGQSADLPESLLEDCIHWLDLNSGLIEIRRRPSIWLSKDSHWTLDFRSRTARRRNGVLVDPHSSLFRRFIYNFSGFELGRYLTVFQPQFRPLTVELRRLELAFSVRHGLLESRQLQAVIDANQDMGTWYGLKSALVLRDIANPLRRSVVIPTGIVTLEKLGMHVAVRVNNEGRFIRYYLDDILGRLSCSAEPFHLYLQAQLHACTSFVLPDPLTERTGLEEALHVLQSGAAQPCTPLEARALACLSAIEDLTPSREYYPPNLKVMAKVTWREHLPFSSQHESFPDLVHRILERSHQLSKFSFNAETSTEILGSTHLSMRALIRGRLLERGSNSAYMDDDYSPRDRYITHSSANVAEAVNLLKLWPEKLPTASHLASTLQRIGRIGGYERIFENPLLSNGLNVNIGSEWGALVRLCQNYNSRDKFAAMFMLGLISFRIDVDMDLVRTLVAFAIFHDLKSVALPEGEAFDIFSQNTLLKLDDVESLLRPCRVPYVGHEITEVTNAEFFLSAKEYRKNESAKKEHEKHVAEQLTLLSKHVHQQWPCAKPSVEGIVPLPYLFLDKALDLIQVKWSNRYQNLLFYNSIKSVQLVLDRQRGEVEPPPIAKHPLDSTLMTTKYAHYENLSLSVLLKTSLVTLTQPPPGDNIGSFSKGSSELQALRPRAAHSSASLSPEVSELQILISDLTSSDSSVRTRYAKGLADSLSAFIETSTGNPVSTCTFSPPDLQSDMKKSRQIIEQQHCQIREHLKRNHYARHWLSLGGLWPCMSTQALLQEVASVSKLLRDHEKACIITFALSLTKLQRLLRIEHAHIVGNVPKTQEELRNIGHSNWSPAQYPDWLLLELENDILIRPDQVEVALATIHPSSASNSLLQMNMGRGKTSCIIPMVAAVLANSKDLLRVIVPRALLIQTAQLLQSRLGHLINRSITHIPFSRKTPTNKDTIKTYLSLHKHALKASGIILTLPEHVMSFKLSGLQRLSDSRIDEAQWMTRIQAFLENHSRDIIDESDLILSLGTQLIYPSGSQTAVDGHPYRWEVVQELLKLVESHTYDLEHRFPNSVEIVRRPFGAYPLISFIRQDAESALVDALVADISHGRTSILPIGDYCRQDRSIVKNFIAKSKVSTATTERIKQLHVDKASIKKTLLLLRGLLVHRILIATLKKRWNVQYGLHPGRDPIAVPFRAKGVPSEQAEFGHVDVSILLTCLAFYYQGVTIDQFRQGLSSILRSDDPRSNYERWTSCASDLPGSLHDWSAINVDDTAQINLIWRHVRFQPAVIDYYLNIFVFPRHAKQFQLKLQASAWDLPLFVSESNDGDSALVPLTTGFSGTNDNRNMLPMNIAQHDLPALANLNAEVLTYLLSPRNRGYVLAIDHRQKRLSESDLLLRIKEMGIRVIIDAGAQILELDNRNLVKLWLEKDYEAPAALFFDDNNKAMIRYRHGLELPLVASTFADDLTDVLVYLDESHCRGTDLKLPRYARGALTLGPGLQKDAAVQAAMRLRLLGTTQSVVFFSPPEVHQNILDLRKQDSRIAVESVDVVRWLLETTCENIESMMPLYYAQGADYCRRTQALSDNSDFITDKSHRDSYLEVLRQKEQQTLHSLYEPKIRHSRKAKTSFSPNLDSFMKELNTRRKLFSDTGNAVHASALQEVEQEREVAYEVEMVREVQKPTHYSPFMFGGLHRDIISFVKTGRLSAGSAAFDLAMLALSRTALGRKHGVKNHTLQSRLYVSSEFCKTVSLPLGTLNDNFQRVVNWIVWSSATETALIVSPEEAEIIIPLIRNLQTPAAYLLTYAAPITRSMLHFDRLDYYSIPSLPSGWMAPTWLKTELGVFAGRLYFEFEEYANMCKFLGINEDDSRSSGGEVTVGEGQIDGTLDGDWEHVLNPAEEDKRPSFTAKPLTFLHEWLVVRRKGQNFVHTPAGYVCQGKPLSSDHPFFASRDGDEDGGRGSKLLVREFLGPDHTLGALDGNQEDDIGDGDFMFEDGENAVEDGSDDENEFFSAEEDGESDSEESVGW
ncbi:hypothetical protein EJ08DRAFT_25307 [Tothia fuscella]|uniref:ubiquitinyl hydrolase 1 n=1 Tax=Tothia fuscella TaxID=1048955 RepID=A0A9P4NGG7_9PEZI|nr:hypothetical protein EJ08DRAFT_25307 [Tothia fuscella]